LPKPAPAPRTSVIILTKDGPPWVRTLEGMAGVNSSRRGLNPACMALGGSAPALAANPANRGKADVLRRKLGLPEESLILLPPEKLGVCGDGEVVVLPANATWLNRARGALQKARQGLDPRLK